MLAAMAENPRLFGARSNYNETRPQMRIRIDENRAADLGVSIGTIGQTLAVMLGSRRATTFVDKGEEYDVILQGRDEDRRTPTDVTNIYVRSDATRELIPLSNLITVEEISDAGTRNRFDRLRSITVMATPAPGYTLGEAITWLGASRRRAFTRGSPDQLERPSTRIQRIRQCHVHLLWPCSARRVPGSCGSV